MAVVWANLDQVGIAGVDPSVLSAKERQRADCLLHPALAQRWRICRCLLREILGKLLALAPGAVRFNLSPLGKPALAPDTHPQNLHFSLSHSGPWAVFAFALDHEIGVDCEAIRPIAQRETFARHWFTPEEQQAIDKCKINDRDELLLRFWVRREALAKGTGRGVAETWRWLQIPVLPWLTQHVARVAWPGPTPSVASDWRISDLDLPAGLLGAVAFAGASATLRIHALPIPVR